MLRLCYPCDSTFFYRTDGKAGARMEKVSFRTRCVQQVRIPATQGFHQAKLYRSGVRSLAIYVVRSITDSPQGATMLPQ